MQLHLNGLSSFGEKNVGRNKFSVNVFLAFVSANLVG